MTWLKQFPWLSLSILLITYSVFGWFIAQSSTAWSEGIIEQGKQWGWILEENLILVDIHLLAIACIVLISLALTAPITFLTIFINNSLKSDIKVFISMLAWSLAFVLLLSWFEYFVRFLVLIAAAILARLDLRTKGYNEWQTFVLLTFFCIGGFALGALTFTLWGHYKL